MFVTIWLFFSVSVVLGCLCLGLIVVLFCCVVCFVVVLWLKFVIASFVAGV